jgi:hypothetical protein
MNGPLQTDEKLAAALGRATGAWAHIEYLLTVLFSIITDLNINMAAAIFEMFKSTHSQADVLNRVAKLSTRIADGYRDGLKEILKDYIALAARRNEIAHNPLGWEDIENTKVYIMTKTKGVPGPDGIPYRRRSISEDEINALTNDIEALKFSIHTLLHFLNNPIRKPTP